MNFRILAAAAAMVLSAGAQAANVYMDDFDGNTPTQSMTPAGWWVSGGTVDVIGPGFYDLLPGNGSYIDLDGSTGSPGLLSTLVAGSAAGVYTVSFDLAGSQRGTTETVVVTFGSASQTFVLGSGDAFSTFTMTTTAWSGPLTLSFQDNVNTDNIGALLDNVSVDLAPVPEPAMGALLMAGLGALALAARRRKAGRA